VSVRLSITSAMDDLSLPEASIVID
jgi:hypothetical protein